MKPAIETTVTADKIPHVAFFSPGYHRFVTAWPALLFLALLLGCFSTAFKGITDPLPPPPHPPMGWSSWYAFHTHISGTIIRQQADAMTSNGMRKAGYEYVNVVDGWQGDRDSQGFLHPNSNFPDMKALGNYLHSKGLKFGIYTSMGPKSCGGYVGSLGYEAQDAQTFLDWGVDFVEYDDCFLEAGVVAESLVYKMSLAIRQREKHPVVLSTVLLLSPWDWASAFAVNMWRIAPDALDTYQNMLQIADADAPLAPFAGKVGWNDPDLLLVGLGGMTTNEYRTHMTLWVMLAAPLISSTDLGRLSPADLAILTNPDAIAINQDPKVQQATRVRQGVVDVWLKSLSNGWAIAVVNRSDQPVQYAVSPNELGIIASQAFEVWTKQTVALPYTATIAAHSCVLLRTI